MKQIVLFFIIIFISMNCKSSANSQADGVLVHDMKSSFKDGEPVEVYLENKTTDDVLILVEIERQVENGDWQALLTKNKAIYQIAIKKGQSEKVHWTFWEDSLTFEELVISGKYRYSFRIFNPEKTQHIEKFYSDEYTIFRANKL